MAMKREVKERWVEALTSGEYRQIQNILADGRGGFCCLGVLNEIQGNDRRKNDIDGAVEYCNSSGDDRFVTYSALKNPGWLETQGLTHAYQSILIDMNDGGSSFDEIADYIDRLVPVVGD